VIWKSSRRRRLEEQLPRASEGVAYLLEQMLAAKGDPNARSQQKKEWRALFYKAEIRVPEVEAEGKDTRGRPPLLEDRYATFPC
jgi:hypothetical protein